MIPSMSLPARPRACLECFAGTHRLSSAWHERGLRVAPPMEICDGPHGDMFSPGVARQLESWVDAGRYHHVHFGTP